MQVDVKEENITGGVNADENNKVDVEPKPLTKTQKKNRQRRLRYKQAIGTLPPVVLTKNPARKVTLKKRDEVETNEASSTVRGGEE